MSEENFEDFYATLGVASNATSGEIKKAWKRQMMEFHPDHHPEKKDYFESRCKAFNTAYKTLRDPQARAAFDKKRAEFFARKRAAKTSAPKRISEKDTKPKPRFRKFAVAICAVLAVAAALSAYFALFDQNESKEVEDDFYAQDSTAPEIFPSSAPIVPQIVQDTPATIPSVPKEISPPSKINVREIAKPEIGIPIPETPTEKIPPAKTSPKIETPPPAIPSSAQTSPRTPKTFPRPSPNPPAPAKTKQNSAEPISPTLPKANQSETPSRAGEYCVFGSETQTPGKGLLGAFFDMTVLARGGKYETEKSFLNLARKFVRTRNKNILAQYRTAPKTLTVAQIFMPTPVWGTEKNAPEAFGLGGKFSSSKWLILYSGTVIPNKSGRIRLLGTADDFLCVRFDNKIRLDAGCCLLTENTAAHSGMFEKKVLGESDPTLSISGFWRTSFRAGPWFRVRAGTPYQIEILAGDTDGQNSCAALLFEVEGKRKNLADEFPKLMRFSDEKIAPELTRGSWNSEIDMSGGDWIFAPKN